MVSVKPSKKHDEAAKHEISQHSTELNKTYGLGHNGVQRDVADHNSPQCPAAQSNSVSQCLLPEWMSKHTCHMHFQIPDSTMSQFVSSIEANELPQLIYITQGVYTKDGVRRIWQILDVHKPEFPCHSTLR